MFNLSNIKEMHIGWTECKSNSGWSRTKPHSSNGGHPWVPTHKNGLSKNYWWFSAALLDLVSSTFTLGLISYLFFLCDFPMTGSISWHHFSHLKVCVLILFCHDFFFPYTHPIFFSMMLVLLKTKKILITWFNFWTTCDGRWLDLYY